jgi:hypothetical protein
MMRAHIRTFGKDLIRNNFVSRPKDLRPWLENVGPRIDFLLSHSKGLSPKMALEIIIRAHRIIQCDIDEFVAFVMLASRMIPNAYSLGSWFYGWTEYFKLPIRRVQEYADRGHTINDFPPGEEQMKQFFTSLKAFASRYDETKEPEGGR